MKLVIWPRLNEVGLIMNDHINNPTHYTSHPSGVECIEITRHMPFNLGNVLKYIWRNELKDNPIEDLKKARFYLDDEIKRLSGEVEPQPADTPNEPYRPKIGEDARTRGGERAHYVKTHKNGDNHLYEINGKACWYQDGDGYWDTIHRPNELDLIAPWEGE